MSESFVTTWPNGARAAASFCFDLDAESAVLSVAPQAATRMSVMTHQSYGPITGVPRLLDILERNAVSATFFVPGYTAHRYPEVVRSIVARGHEIAHHGYLHEPLGDADEETEIRYLDRGIEALQEVAGVTPVGYRAPMWELNYRSAELLHERGFLYDSSLMDADRPYELATGHGNNSIVEIPIHWGLDDWEQYGYVPELFGSGLIASPAKVRGMWSLELNAMIAAGGCFVLTTHPFLTGRPSRAVALEEIVKEAVAASNLWVATMGEIARHTRAQSLSPRVLAQPQF